MAAARRRCFMRDVCHAQSACESPAKRLGRAFQCELDSTRFTLRASHETTGCSGAVAEWSKALAWKVRIRQKRIEGSNPSRSAISLSPRLQPKSGEVQTPVFPAEIEQGIAVRLELRADHPADEDEVVAGLVERFALTFE